MLIAGIDPGLSGAVALMDKSRSIVRLADIPTYELVRGGKKKRDIDPALVNLFDCSEFGYSIDHAYIEQVNAMPGQGGSSIFQFGKVYGILLGILWTLGIPYTPVSPVRWKKALGVPAAKDGARARASQLMPAAAHHWPLVKHDGRAEAALIAYWGLRQ